MSTANTYKNLRAWAKTSSLGVLIPGSVQFRKNRPVGPNWHELTLDYCCNNTGDSIITFQNNATNSITSISFSGTNYTTSLDTGKMVSFILPRGYDQTINITDDMFNPIDFTATTVQGDGVIAPSSGLDSTGTYTLTTTGVPNSQYLVVITND